MKAHAAAEANCNAVQAGLHLEAGLPSKLPSMRIDPAIIIQDVDAVQVVALAGGVVIGVMGGRDLHCSSAKAHVHQLSVLNDGYLAPIQGMYHKLAV